MKRPSIKKIKAYNQILISIAGTIGLLFLLCMGIILIVEECNLYFDDYTPTPSGIIATQQTDSLLNDSIRRQVIAFQKIELI